VTVAGCLHLKTAVTRVGDDLLLLNPEWIDHSSLPRMDYETVDPVEPYGANALSVAGTVLVPASAPRTRERLERRGLRVRAVDNSELAKAEAAHCCSLMYERGGRLSQGGLVRRRVTEHCGRLRVVAAVFERVA
jgi:dimethylargininase